ncbi:peptidoglycan-associated lipoprotein Pal [Celerinatantimonas sp. YJH-8]|uniref:peptidoglycan-associated lipoprotein Pal n=1 Tax=Celerinatantimonas sp. YJH-8 TaxID=3228714 RepID=UPI0038C48E71
MQVSSNLKGVLIAVVLGALSACSMNHSKSANDGNVQVTGGETASQQAANSGQNGSNVEVGSADQVLSLQEQKQQQLDALKQNQTIYFEFDKSEIRNEFVQLLEEHAAFLRNHPDVHVLIEGHTDERGTPEYNIALGERRAKAVVQYLESLGVSADQISTISYGEEKPVDNSHTPAGMAKNRRAVLVY